MLSYSVYNCLSNRVLLFLNNGVRFDIFAVLRCHLRTPKILLLKTSLSCVLVTSEAGGVQLTCTKSSSMPWKAFVANNVHLSAEPSF